MNFVLVGLFIGIVELVSAFMTLSSSKKIIKNSNNQNYYQETNLKD